jgi:hypothetical protein
LFEVHILSFPVAEAPMDEIRRPLVTAAAPMDEIRKPLVIAAAILIVVALAIELGSRLWIGGTALAPDSPRPGLGIPSLAAVDALLAMSLAMVASGALGISANLLARASGCVTTIVSFLTLLASIIMVFVTISLLMLMVGLLLSPPFGTIAYMAAFASFKRGAAAVTLGLLMTLKLVAALVAFLGNQNILKSKSLILLFATSILLTFVISLLHGLVPGFLVSITDAIGAIIAFICAIIWAVLYLVGGIISIVGNLKLSRKKSG